MSDTYPATDGSMPEDVTVELDGNAASSVLVMNVLNQLLDAPKSSRLLADWEHELIEKEARRGE